MIELLYSTGLRVSELINLRTAEVHPDYLHTLGKGKKARIIPLGQLAQAAIARYVSEARPVLLRGREHPALFVTNRGGPMTSPPVAGYPGKSASFSANSPAGAEL